jgi:hypothetical protein
MRRFSWIIGLVLVVGIVGLLMCLKDMHVFDPLRPIQGDRLAKLSIRFKNAQFVGRAGGKKVWSLKAKTIDVSRDMQTATFGGVTDGKLIKDGKLMATLSAGRMMYNTFSRNISVPASADFKLADGPAFKVRNVVWDAGASRLMCTGGVDIVLGGSTLHGQEMTADLEKKELSLRKVNGKIRVEPDALDL